MKLYCVFTFHEVLQKIFSDKKSAEDFKKLYCSTGFIREYSLDSGDFLGKIINNKDSNKGESK